MMKPIYMAVLLSWISFMHTACTSVSSFTKLNRNEYQAKPLDCDIEVLMEEPKAQHEKLGIITTVSGQTTWSGKDLNSMLPSMRKQACLVGADAIIITQIEEGGFAWVTATQGKASALAIKYLARKKVVKNGTR